MAPNGAIIKLKNEITVEALSFPLDGPAETIWRSRAAAPQRPKTTI
jgi:hypothetical protein